MKRIYLDYTATTPVALDVLAVMKPYFSKKFGNPNSLHFFGQEAITALDKSREKIAKIIGADFHEIIFTSSATEANNLALKGIIQAARSRIIISSIEHESILETARDLEKRGIEVIYLPVNCRGFVDLKKLEKSLNKNTILVSVMYANNEIGTIQPIVKISEIIKNFRDKEKTNYPLFHTDAVQVFQFLDCNVNNLGVDLMTLSAHKIYGPKGIGLLYIKSQIQPTRQSFNKSGNFKSQTKFLSPVITGGNQEFSLRSGTENIPAIVGFTKAIELAAQNRKKEEKKIKDFADYFWKRLKKIYPKAELNNSYGECLPNILNIYFPKKSTEELLIKFDLVGVAVSGGSACSARKSDPSYVLRACGLPLNRIKSSLRISFGKYTTKEEINEAIKRIAPIV